jgi:hypothetical protein
MCPKNSPSSTSRLGLEGVGEHPTDATGGGERLHTAVDDAHHVVGIADLHLAEVAPG